MGLKHKHSGRFSTPLTNLIDQRDRLLVMAQREDYTPRTRELCMICVEQYNDVIAFRMKPKRERIRLIKKGVTPWHGTFSWRDDEDRKDRVA